MVSLLGSHIVLYKESIGVCSSAEPFFSPDMSVFNIYAKPAAKLYLSEVSQEGAGVYKSFEGAGDFSEDKSHWVMNVYLYHLSGELQYIL